MKLKDFNWSQVKINDTRDINPFGKVTGSDFLTEKDYNNFLIKDYIASENKYMESYAKVFRTASNEKMFTKDEDLVWVCQHCGYIHNNSSAPKSCPICGSSRAYFGLQY
ncbi:MAG: hypothetical protein MJ244_00890 [Clostridia bacterium]|nr:hypothetical protein [Clostridia bacterium]